MIFENLSKTELRKVAEEFGVEIEDGAKKHEMITAIETDGVTWDMYKKAFPDVEEPAEQVQQTNEAPVESKPVKASDQVLMKMTRKNPTYEIRGHRFTRKHPFALVSSDDANYIVENIDGFRIASPREAEEFYS
jgi:hypothetical protein